jgi:hypothetical protein
VRIWLRLLGWAAVAATLVLSSGGVVAVAVADDAQGACQGTCQGGCEHGCQGAHGTNAAGAAPTCEAPKVQAHPRPLALPKQPATAADGGEAVAIPLNTRGYNYEETAPAEPPPSGPVPAPERP